MSFQICVLGYALIICVLVAVRFYWDKDLNDCVVKQVLSVFVYGYEYQGGLRVARVLE